MIIKITEEHLEFRLKINCVVKINQHYDMKLESVGKSGIDPYNYNYYC